MGKKKHAPPPASPAAGGPFNSAFAGLGGLRDQLPTAPEPPPEAPTATPADIPDAHGWLRAKLVVRHERKGRGGKTVTLLEGVPAADRDPLARELARALGCRASCEEDVVMLSGDLRPRLLDWLKQRGAKRVVAGS